MIGPLREMALKERLVGGDIFDPDGPLARLQFQNAVHQQKRIPVRQNFFDGFNVQYRQNVSPQSTLQRCAYSDSRRARRDVQRMAGLDGNDMRLQRPPDQRQIADQIQQFVPRQFIGKAQRHLVAVFAAERRAFSHDAPSPSPCARSASISDRKPKVRAGAISRA